MPGVAGCCQPAFSKWSLSAFAVLLTRIRLEHMTKSLPAVAVAAAVLATATGAGTASAVCGTTRPNVQSILNRTASAGVPSVVAEIRDGDARWFGAAGVSDTNTGRKRQPHERFRVGSTSKVFTAVVVLQLAAEGKLSLDDTVDKWLPGLVTGVGPNAHDGRLITIRQLLNHTSGVYNYLDDEELFSKGKEDAWFVHRYDSYTPEQLVKVAMSHERRDAPGVRFWYSNTNYFLAGMIAERASGRSLSEEMDRRIFRPLRLTESYLPGAEAKIRGHHTRHYSVLFSQNPQAPVYDATEMNQSFAWAAGGVVSSTGDLHRFFTALLSGHLLPTAQQQEMFTMTQTQSWIPGTHYGLGVFSQDLPCGVKVWGGGGATYGSWSYAMGTRDGKHMLVTQMSADWVGLSAFFEMLTAEFCPAST